VSGHSQGSDGQKEFEELVKAADPLVYSKLPQDVRPQVMRMVEIVVSQITKFSGPLPPPDQLAKYNQVLPGAADRIMTMAEHQSAHRMELEKLVVSGQLNQSNRGQTLAFIIAILFLIGALTATLLGHDAVGGALGTTAVLGLVATFIAGKWEQSASLQKKAPPERQLEDEEP
jgi:uncharacterized membrane protein